jgi:hypothetical protein
MGAKKHGVGTKERAIVPKIPRWERRITGWERRITRRELTSQDRNKGSRDGNEGSRGRYLTSHHENKEFTRSHLSSHVENSAKKSACFSRLKANIASAPDESFTRVKNRLRYAFYNRATCVDS